MAIPAFVAGERGVEVDDEDALEVGVEAAALISLLELALGSAVTVETDVELEDEDPAVAVAVPTIELVLLAASNSACGAIPAHLSSVGFAQSTPPANDHEQHAHIPVSALYITSGTGLSAQCSVHSPLE